MIIKTFAIWLFLGACNICSGHQRAKMPRKFERISKEITLGSTIYSPVLSISRSRGYPRFGFYNKLCEFHDNLKGRQPHSRTNRTRSFVATLLHMYDISGKTFSEIITNEEFNLKLDELINLMPKHWHTIATPILIQFYNIHFPDAYIENTDSEEYYFIPQNGEIQVTLHRIAIILDKLEASEQSDPDMFNDKVNLNHGPNRRMKALLAHWRANKQKWFPELMQQPSRPVPNPGLVLLKLIKPSDEDQCDQQIAHTPTFYD